MHPSFSLEMFSPHLGEPFWIRLSDGRVETRLVEAAGLGGDRLDGRTPFSLVFLGPGRFALPQQIYRVEHEELGEFEIFLVPLGPDGTGMKYEAIFT